MRAGVIHAQRGRKREREEKEREEGEERGKIKLQGGRRGEFKQPSQAVEISIGRSDPHHITLRGKFSLPSLSLRLARLMPRYRHLATP